MSPNWTRATVKVKVIDGLSHPVATETGGRGSYQDLFNPQLQSYAINHTHITSDAKDFM